MEREQRRAGNGTEEINNRKRHDAVRIRREEKTNSEMRARKDKDGYLTKK